MALRPRVVRGVSLTAPTLAALAAVALAACAGGPPEPAPIVLDEDACSHCRMTISEREYAAELVTREGQVERFDDVGCLAAWLREGHDRNPDEPEPSSPPMRGQRRTTRWQS